MVTYNFLLEEFCQFLLFFQCTNLLKNPQNFVKILIATLTISEISHENFLRVGSLFIVLFKTNCTKHI